MALVPSGRSAGEIRDRFIERLNIALLMPGMFGDEPGTQLLLDDLAWIDRRDAELGSVTGTLDKIGAWSSAGVAGRFQVMFGRIRADHGNAAALVYASVARAWGYLVPQRELSAAEYSQLRQNVRSWTTKADRTVTDVITAFGAPSLWRPKYNPRFPVSVAYVSERLADPLVTFDFWQDAQWGRSRPRRSRFGTEPVLRNVRWLDGQFQDGFTYTPIGSTLLKPSDPEE